MKISQQTLDILKNFSTINKSLIIEPGNKLVVRNSETTILAEANVNENFSQFVILDLNKFLNITSLFDDPEYNFTEQVLTITENNHTVEYISGNADILDPEGKFRKALKNSTLINFNKDVEFHLTAKNIKSIITASNVLKSEFIVIESKNNRTFIHCNNIKNPSSDKYSFELPLSLSKNFKYVIKIEKIRLMNYDYKVYIDFKGIVQFEKEKDFGLKYFIATEATHNIVGSK